jgi:hypothetical protein
MLPALIKREERAVQAPRIPEKTGAPGSNSAVMLTESGLHVEKHRP